MPLGHNRVLGDPKVPAAARPHRVALAHWPTVTDDRRSATLEALLGHAASAGYEGLEYTAGGMARYFPQGTSLAVVARKARQAVEKAGLRVFGGTLHVSDAQMRDLAWPGPITEHLKPLADLGGEFAGYQIDVHPQYLHTGGAYRDDEPYLRWCAQRVSELRDATWAEGLNFYLEVHVDRITEDPAALCRILDMASVELNGDMSHYLCRGFLKGPQVERVLRHLGHTHVRMARMYGDLSAGVDDPAADWAAKGATWHLFDLMKKGLEGGLSSRTISGETGPMYLVKDALTQDARLIPLYRALARYADARAQGIGIKVEGPDDLKPWG